jgi:GT2 family glycosyltransferase
VPAASWLSALRDGFDANPGCMLGGPKQNALPHNLYSSAHQIASNYPEEWFRSATDIAGYFMTNNLAVPREVFLSIGGFNESFRFAHEDREFGARWADHGLASAWTPGAIVAHRHELTFGAFLRQHFRYGIGAIDFRMARGGKQVRRRVRFEGLRFHAGLIAQPFVHSGLGRSLQLAALLALAQAAYLAGVVVTALPVRRRRAGGGDEG